MMRKRKKGTLMGKERGERLDYDCVTAPKISVKN
jgi:hypothetical protein